MKYPRITGVNTMLRRFLSLLIISAVVALVTTFVWAATQWTLFVYSIEGYHLNQAKGLLLQVGGIAIFTLLSYGVIRISVDSMPRRPARKALRHL